MSGLDLLCWLKPGGGLIYPSYYRIAPAPLVDTSGFMLQLHRGRTLVVDKAAVSLGPVWYAPHVTVRRLLVISRTVCWTNQLKNHCCRPKGHREFLGLWRQYFWKRPFIRLCYPESHCSWCSCTLCGFKHFTPECVLSLTFAIVSIFWALVPHKWASLGTASSSPYLVLTSMLLLFIWNCAATLNSFH